MLAHRASITKLQRPQEAQSRYLPRSCSYMICLPPGWRGWAVPRPSTTTCGESTHVWLRRRPPRSQRICLRVVGSGRVGAYGAQADAATVASPVGPGALGRASR